MKRKIGILFALVAGLTGAMALWAARGQDATVTLRPDQQFQTIFGWEASTDLPDTPVSPEWAPYADQLFETVVADVGIDRLRLEVRSGAESRHGGPDRFLSGAIDHDAWRDLRYVAENDNDDPFVIDPSGFNFAELDWHVQQFVLPLRAALARHGRGLIVNLCYVAFQDGPYFQMEPEEYAELVLAVYQHLEQKWGFTPDVWEVVLEPDLSKNSWTGTQMGLAMAAAAKRLKAHGYSVAFAAPSVTNLANAMPYAREIAAIDDANQHWAEVTYHRYRRASPRRVAALADFAQDRGLRTGMTEWWFGRGDFDTLYEDITIGMNSTWQGRTLPGLVAGPGADGALTLKPEVRENRLIFTSAPTGSVRLGADSSDKNIKPVAFRTPEGGTNLVVQVKSRATVTVHDMPPGAYTVTVLVADTETQTPLQVGADGKVVIDMRARGVFALQSKKEL